MMSHPIGNVTIEISGRTSSGKTPLARRIEEMLLSDNMFNMISIESSCQLKDGSWGDKIVVSMKTAKQV